tara:strand:+ start:565 stop:759 length:195 start_codon:yes stop_codon:yes gene_type:complete
MDLLSSIICVGAAIILVVTLLTVRNQQQKMYELEQRIFYIEDVLIDRLYGPEFNNNNQVNFNNY